MICEAGCHIVNYEIGGMAALSGLLPRMISAPQGLLDPAAVEAAIAPDASYRARTVLIEIENTANMAGGTVYDRPRLEAILDVAAATACPSTSTAPGCSTPPRRWASRRLAGRRLRLADVLASRRGWGRRSARCSAAAATSSQEARRVRKMLGGGMRQAGILAAAGLLALRKGPDRLPEDHENACPARPRRSPACAAIELDPAAVRTNIVIFRLTPELCGGSAAAFLGRTEEAGVLGGAVNAEKVRFVTHRDVSRAQIDEAIERIDGSEPWERRRSTPALQELRHPRDQSISTSPPWGARPPASWCGPGGGRRGPRRRAG